MIQLVTFARDCFTYRWSIDKSHRERERESVEREEEKSPGTKKEGKLSWNISGFLAKLACYLKSSSVEQSRDWNVLLSQKWSESRQRCIFSRKRIMVDGLKASKLAGS